MQLTNITILIVALASSIQALPNFADTTPREAAQHAGAAVTGAANAVANAPKRAYNGAVDGTKRGISHSTGKLAGFFGRLSDKYSQ